MTTMTAYHGDPELKTRTVAEMAAHREADQIVAGTYWLPKEHKGCAVGCMTENPDGGHDQFPARWGIPEELAWLEDTLFEGLSRELRVAWPERFLTAIPVGADLSRVYARFSAALMLDPERGNIVRCAGYPEVEAAVRLVGGLWQAETTTVEPAAEAAAESAARRSAARAERDQVRRQCAEELRKIHAPDEAVPRYCSHDHQRWPCDSFLLAAIWVTPAGEAVPVWSTPDPGEPAADAAEDRTALLREQAEVVRVLAAALHYAPDGGWGDHTVVTLAEEAAAKLGEFARMDCEEEQ